MGWQILNTGGSYPYTDQTIYGLTVTELYIGFR